MKRLLTTLAASLLAGVVCVSVQAQELVRLSAYLETQPNIYLQAVGQQSFILWYPEGEKKYQDEFRRSLLQSQGLKGRHTEIQRLKRYLEDVSITGRVPLPSQDPQYIKFNPIYDPYIRAEQIRVVTKQKKIAVLNPQSQVCVMPLRPEAQTRYYVQACEVHGDWAWLIEVDGRVSRVSLADWNYQSQSTPTDGAWIWVPHRDLDLALQRQIVHFLSWQEPVFEQKQLIHLSPIPRIDNSFLLQKHVAEKKQDLTVTSNDWGLIGLLQTPTARFAPEGHMNVSISEVAPYRRMNMFITPFEWVEAGFRYTDIKNRAYGPASFSGDQSYKDKSIDLKVRLWSESAYWPQAAVGIQDIAGTGLFSSEYVVLNKRWGNFDWSVGAAWGYLANGQNYSNPLSRFSEAYATRRAPDVGRGGEFSWKTYFSGPMGLFGGLQYQTPWSGWLVKVEKDGNSYQLEPLNNPQRKSLGLNFGVVKRFKNVDLTVGMQRGNQIGVGLSLHGNLASSSIPKVSELPAPQVINYQVSPPQAPPSFSDKAITEIENMTGWKIDRIIELDTQWILRIATRRGLYIKEPLEKVIATLHQYAPLHIQQFIVEYAINGVYVQDHKVDRWQFVKAKTEFLPESKNIPAIVPETAGRPVDLLASTSRPKTVFEQESKRYDGGLGLAYSHILGGPDGFWFYNLSLRASGYYRLWNGAWLQGSTDLKLLNNFDNYRTGTVSQLPRVRTYLREYATATDVTIPNLQFTQVQSLGANQFASVYAGILENYFMGVGTEWLYRPADSRLALGVDLNRVTQRDFDQRLGAMDYRVNTGHISLYWDTGWHGLLATTHYGQYLAGDRGATFNLSRVFQNGVTVGAFVTRTNVSAEQFGEGSFDKGIYLSVPFDFMLTKASSNSVNFLWKPITRDGGAMLSRHNTLYDLTGIRDKKALWYK